MNKKQKKMLIRIIVAAVLIVLFSKLPIDGYVQIWTVYDSISGNWL